MNYFIKSCIFIKNIQERLIIESKSSQKHPEFYAHTNLPEDFLSRIMTATIPFAKPHLIQNDTFKQQPTGHNIFKNHAIKISFLSRYT